MQAEVEEILKSTALGIPLDVQQYLILPRCRVSIPIAGGQMPLARA